MIKSIKYKFFYKNLKKNPLKKGNIWLRKILIVPAIGVMIVLQLFFDYLAYDISCSCVYFDKINARRQTADIDGFYCLFAL